MIPAEVNLQIMQGDRHEIYFRAQEQIFDEGTQAWIPGNYINLTGKTIKAQIRKTVADSTVAAEFTCSVVEPQSDPEITGSGYGYLLPSQTATLVEPSYVWDLEVSSDTEHVDTWFAGVVTVKMEVTR